MHCGQHKEVEGTQTQSQILSERPGFCNLSPTASGLKDGCEDISGKSFLSVLDAEPLGRIPTEFTLNLGSSAAPAVSRVEALNLWTSIFRVDGDRYKVMLRLPL